MVDIQRVSMETAPTLLIEIGYRLGIHNAHTFSKETLVAKVNRKIDQREGVSPIPRQPSTNRAPRTKSAQPAKKAASVDGLVVTILGKPQKDGKTILANRKMKVTAIKEDMLIGFLIKESGGTLQNSEIKMEKKYTNYTAAKEA